MTVSCIADFLLQSWAMVDPKANEKFKVLNAYTNSENNRIAYRTLLANFPLKSSDSQFALSTSHALDARW